MLWTRIATAAVGIPLALVLIWVGGWPLDLAVALVAALSFWEFFRLIAAPERLDYEWALLLWIGLVAALVFTWGPGTDWWAGCILLSLLLLLFVAHPPFPLTRRGSAQRAVAGIGGLFYTVTTLGFVLRLRALVPGTVRHTPVPLGAALLFLAIGACWVTDAAAYLVGRKIGRHKLAPKISPGKTIEGGVAGLVGAVLFVGALGWWVGLPVWSAALLGGTLGVVGQLGDLFESWLKRRAGVKDSGALLPGHGGVLDRFDSLLFVAPVAYYWLRAVLG
jgi:phosphatidate cytidylyltransferase